METSGRVLNNGCFAQSDSISNLTDSFLTVHLLPLLAPIASASCSDSDLAQIALKTTPRHVACADLPSGPPLPDSPCPWTRHPVEGRRSIREIAAMQRENMVTVDCLHRRLNRPLLWRRSAGLYVQCRSGLLRHRDRPSPVSFDSNRAVTLCMIRHSTSVTTMSEQP